MSRAADDANEMTPHRLINGAAATRAAAELEKKRRRHDEAPYEWLYPPPDAEYVYARGTIAATGPGPTTETEVLKYIVPANRRFYLWGLFQLLIGGAANNPGDGNIAWNVSVDIPVGITSLQGYYLQGLSEVLAAGTSNFPLGNFQQGLNSPFLLPKPEEIGEGRTLRSTVIATATITGGTGGRFYSAFLGWLVEA